MNQNITIGTVGGYSTVVHGQQEEVVNNVVDFGRDELTSETDHITQNRFNPQDDVNRDRRRDVNNNNDEDRDMEGFYNDSLEHGKARRFNLSPLADIMNMTDEQKTDVKFLYDQSEKLVKFVEEVSKENMKNERTIVELRRELQAAKDLTTSRDSVMKALQGDITGLCTSMETMVNVARNERNDSEKLRLQELDDEREKVKKLQDEIKELRKEIYTLKQQVLTPHRSTTSEPVTGGRGTGFRGRGRGGGRGTAARGGGGRGAQRGRGGVERGRGRGGRGGVRRGQGQSVGRISFADFRRKKGGN